MQTCYKSFNYDVVRYSFYTLVYPAPNLLTSRNRHFVL